MGQHRGSRNLADCTCSRPPVNNTAAVLLPCRFPEDSDPSKLFQVSRTRRQERRADAPRRSVLQCYLFAPGEAAAAAACVVHPLVLGPAVPQCSCSRKVEGGHMARWSVMRCFCRRWHAPRPLC